MPLKDDKDQPTTTSKIMTAIISGGSLMLGQTPAVNALNRVSVMACRYNLSTIESIKKIYRGDALHSASLMNFNAGIGGHLGKEIPRLLFKPTGLYVLKPWLETQMTVPQATFVFAASLSIAEMAINPADTWRVNIQAGQKLEKSLQRLYAGSLGNGFRQFGSWYGFLYSSHKLNNFLSQQTTIDPNSYLGIGIKSYPQSLFFTSFVYPIERLKNELQYSEKTEQKGQLKKYPEALKKIIKTQGMSGLFKGFHPKVASNSVLTLCANYLMAEGQKQTAKK